MLSNASRALDRHASDLPRPMPPMGLLAPHDVLCPCSRRHTVQPTAHRAPGCVSRRHACCRHLGEGHHPGRVTG
ncbi:MAG: hypothetical protein NVV74_14585 [Magnetospirillum sp.]|nr:hypothetical protein [Magnetospirillum sp.]